MRITPAERGNRKPVRLSQEVRENDVLERARIQASMRKWQGMDETAKMLGRGLGKKELFDRVALEVGKSLRQVHEALKV